jgi:hypothetical protein
VTHASGAAASHDAAGGFALVCAVLLATSVSPASAQTKAGPLAGPPAAVAAARAALNDSARGAPLHVSVLTQGQGHAVWEHYGHNLIWIRNDATGESNVWNWGVFDFADPAFIVRFLFGNAKYRIQRYESNFWFNNEGLPAGRDLIAQELALTPGQRAAVDAFVRTNELDANKYYRYDYYLDNCSTRLRDVLDLALGGAIRSSLEPRTGQRTFRGETLRLNQQNGWLFLGLDFALGKPADRTMTPWEEAFVPMRLRDALRTVTVRNSAGESIPLVRSERVIVRSPGPPERAVIDSTGVRVALLVSALGCSLLVLVLGALARRGKRVAAIGLTTAAVVLHSVLGAFASLLVFMWCFTRHAFWAWNAHLLLLTPVSIAVAMALARSKARRPPERWIERYHMLMAVSGFVVSVAVAARYRGAFTPAAELLLAWASASWLVHLSLSVAFARLTGAPSESPPPPAAAGARMAA